jgi:hypothetical protein
VSADEFLDRGQVGLLAVGRFPLGENRQEVVEDGRQPRLTRNRPRSGGSRPCSRQSLFGAAQTRSDQQGL